MSISPLFGQFCKNETWFSDSRLFQDRGETYRTSHPERRPYPTSTTRHMLKVKHDKAVGVLLCACYANAVAATARCHTGGVGLDRHDTIVNVDESVALSCALVHIIDIAVSRIIFSIKCHQIEKVAARVVVGKTVLGDGKWNQSTAKQKRGKKVHIGWIVMSDYTQKRQRSVRRGSLYTANKQ